MAARLVLPPLQPLAVSVIICSLDNCSLLLLLLLPQDDADDDVADPLLPVDVFRGFSCGACLAYSTFSSCKILCSTVSIWTCSRKCYQQQLANSSNFSAINISAKSCQFYSILLSVLTAKSAEWPFSVWNKFYEFSSNISTQNHVTVAKTTKMLNFAEQIISIVWNKPRYCGHTK